MKRIFSLLLGLCLIFSDTACSKGKEPEESSGIALPQIIRTTPPIRVVCVGNSITAGYGSTSEATAWPAFLNLRLGSSYAVINCGVSGTTMFKNSDAPYWKTDRFKKAVESDPQILVLALGTNDADPWRWNKWKQQFKSDYLDMVNEFRRNGKDPIIYICLPPPLFGLTKNAQNTIIEVELIPMLMDIATEIGAYVVDYHQPLINAADKFPDTVHPDDAGAEQMAQIAYNYMEKAQRIWPKAFVKKGEIINGTTIWVEAGGEVTLSPQPAKGKWTWIGPDGFISHQRVVTMKNIQRGGVYSAVYTDNEGKRSVINYLITIKGLMGPPIIPRIKKQDGKWINSTLVRANPGANIIFAPETNKDGSWSWIGPGNTFAGTRELSLRTLLPKQAGKYTATFTDKEGKQNSIVFTVEVSGEPLCPNLTPYINYGGWKQTYEMEVLEGDNVTFGPHPSDGNWRWEGPDGFSSNRREATVSGFNKRKAGNYTGTFTNAAGCKEQLIITLKMKEH